MSRIPINDYLREIGGLRRVSGTSTEEVVREAFKDLLKAWSRRAGLHFVAQRDFLTLTGSKVTPDGAVLHELRLPLGWWEAKDTDDDLDAEIEKKLRRGYPRDNIVFENGATAVLWQNRAEVMRCDMTDVEALDKLLRLFFGYERPEIAGFREAVAQFRADLPHVLDALHSRIEDAYRSNSGFRTAAAEFLALAKATINPTLGEADVREMLFQHILAGEIFANVFNDADFHRANNIAKALYALEGRFFTGGVKRDTLKGLEPYYAAIRANAAKITRHAEKQAFLKAIYETFYKVYNPKAADRAGRRLRYVSSLQGVLPAPMRYFISAQLPDRRRQVVPWHKDHPERAASAAVMLVRKTHSPEHRSRHSRRIGHVHAHRAAIE